MHEMIYGIRTHEHQMLYDIRKDKHIMYEMIQNNLYTDECCSKIDVNEILNETTRTHEWIDDKMQLKFVIATVYVISKVHSTKSNCS